MPYDEDVVVEVLQDRADRPVLRLRDRVRHPMQPWSASVHSLLAHLQDVGFAEAPVPYGGNGEWDEVGFMVRRLGRHRRSARAVARGGGVQTRFRFA